MGKSKRSESKATVASKKKLRALPPLHETQEKLAQRAAKLSEEDLARIQAERDRLQKQFDESRRAARAPTG